MVTRRAILAALLGWLSPACAQGDDARRSAADDASQPRPTPGVGAATAEPEDWIPVDSSGSGPPEDDDTGEAPACVTAEDCPAATCLAGACVPASTCDELHSLHPTLQSGRYPLDLDGGGGEATVEAYCDMDTDGGGWTVVYATDALDGRAPITALPGVDGNPLAFEPYNLGGLEKVAVNELSAELLVRRPGARWLIASTAPFDARLLAPDSELEQRVPLRAADGTSTNAWVAWSNFNRDGGGDFAITFDDDPSNHDQRCVDAETTPDSAHDRHSADFWLVNCACVGHYLFSYSAAVLDGDAAYRSTLALGDWTPTGTCGDAETSGVPLLVALR